MKVMKEMFETLYDVMVYLTSNYSNLPEGFKKRFPESLLVKARLFVSNIVNFEWNDEE